MTTTVNGTAHAGIAVFTVLFLAVVLTARWWNTPVREPGRHRGPRVRAVVADAVLDDLLGDWEPVYGAALAQKWDDCPVCGRATAGVMQGDDGWLCGEFYRHPAGSEAAS